jgi:hypothetical protein
MFVKSRAVAIAIAAAGLVGFAAPMASAATVSGPGDNGGLLNVSHNQVPVQACGNDVNGNVLGVQVPVHGLSGALGILTGGSATTSNQDNSCHLKNNQGNDAIVKAWGGSMGGYMSGGSKTVVVPSSDNGGLVNVSHNQVPIQLCNNTVPVNVLGAQVPLDQITAALGLGTAGSTTTSNQDNSCHLKNGQQG